MIKVTQKAADKIEELMKKEGGREKQVRINLDSVTWGGPSFSLALEEPSNYIGDEEVSVRGMRIVYESQLARYLAGKMLDFTTGNFAPEFKVQDFRPGEWYPANKKRQ